MTTRTHITGGARLVVGLLGPLVLLCSLLAAPASADPASDKRAEARRIADQLDKLGQSVSVLAEQVDAGRLKAGDLAVEVAAAERDLSQAEAEASGARSRLAVAAVDTYVQGGVDLGAVPALDNGSDPLRRRQYAMTMQARKSDVLDAAKAEAAVVREKKARLEEARKEAQGVVDGVERAQREAEAAATRLESTQGKIDGDLAALVEQEQQDRAAVEAADVQHSLAASNPASPVATLAAPPRAMAVVAAPRAPAATIRPGSSAPGAAPAATPTTPPKPAPDAGNEATAPNSGAAAAVAEARRQIGKPYRWGGVGPDSFDCSGLTAWAWRAGGRSLPHSSQAQYASLPKVNAADAQPGDLFAFGSPIHHIGIYVGGGQMVDAPETGKNVQYYPAYRRDLVGVVRP